MAAPPRRSWWARLLLSFGAGAACAVLVAIFLAIVDLYLTGHQLPTLSAPLVDWPRVGVHLSLADVMFLGAGVLGASITWSRTGRGST